MATEHDDVADAEPDDGATRERRRPLPHIPSNILAFAGVLCAGVLIGWIVFRDDDPPAPATPTAAGQPVAAFERVYPKLGITLDLPKGWKTSFRRSVLTAVAQDETVSFALSAAGGGGEGPAFAAQTATSSHGCSTPASSAATARRSARRRRS